MTPVIQLVAFEDRYNKFVFVRVPNERGRYVRTDPCVVQVPCPHCKSAIGEPCKGRQVYWGGTHSDRRRDAAFKRGWKHLPMDQIHDKIETERDWLVV